VLILDFFVGILAKNKHKEIHKKVDLPLCQLWRGAVFLTRGEPPRRKGNGYPSFNGTFAEGNRGYSLRRSGQLRQHGCCLRVREDTRQRRPADQHDHR